MIINNFIKLSKDSEDKLKECFFLYQKRFLYIYFILFFFTKF